MVNNSKDAESPARYMHISMLLAPCDMLQNNSLCFRCLLLLNATPYKDEKLRLSSKTASLFILASLYKFLLQIQNLPFCNLKRKVSLFMRAIINRKDKTLTGTTKVFI